VRGVFYIDISDFLQTNLIEYSKLYQIVVNDKGHEIYEPVEEGSNSQLKIFTQKTGQRLGKREKLNAKRAVFYLIFVYKPFTISLKLPNKCCKPPYPEKHRVRAGVSIKGQAKGLSFYADRPRTSVSLSIAQRRFDGQFIELRIAKPGKGALYFILFWGRIRV
jgi:hypothetical protein